MMGWGGVLRVGLAALAGLALAATGSFEAGAAPRTTAAAAGPIVQHMVVFRSGRASIRRVRASATFVRASGRRCAVRRGTPLAALVRARPGRLRLRDFGSCSASVRDGGGLFVSGIGGELNRGKAGWVYKIGSRAGTAGAAGPNGPFGRGLLRSRARVLWFYCRDASACQRTLATAPQALGGGGVAVRVIAYDDEGRGAPAVGATVFVGGASAVTGPDGVAQLTVAPGTYPVRAEQSGLVRSFTETLVVR